MDYFLDTEFNSFGGELISLALVREDDKSIYLIYPELESYDPWVADNILPILHDVPPTITCHVLETKEQAAYLLQEFFLGDYHPRIITDWPDDIRYFCAELITKPGQMINVPNINFSMLRVNAYPTLVQGAVQHNAWWDAVALKELVNQHRHAESGLQNRG